MLPGKKYMIGNQAPFINKDFLKPLRIRSKLKNTFLTEWIEGSRQRYNKQRNLCVFFLKKSKLDYFKGV